ncbi:hypothetical protein BLA6860_06618 [Burkholderia lata]|nr:hypothetical protein BLA6860_06618 [Burkholderia lata]
MRVGKRARQPEQVGEVHRLVEPRAAAAARLFERERAERHDFDARLPHAHFAGQHRGFVERGACVVPAARGQRRARVCSCLQQHDGAPPQRPVRRKLGCRDRIDPLDERVAGRLAIACRVNAHLFGETCDRQARQAARDAHRVERFEQVDRTVLDAAQQRDARSSAIAEQHGIGRARMFEHVEPVREQRCRLVDAVGLVRERRAHRREHAGEWMATSEIGFRTRQRRRQRVVGQPDLALAQVAQARDQFAPARDIAEPGRRFAARRRVLETARLRRFADDDRARRQPVRVHLREPGRRRWREVGPRFEQLDEAVDFVGVIRSRAEDQRAFVAHRRGRAGIREDARDLALRLDMALAERQRPCHRDA